VAISGFAAWQGRPVLLTHKDRLPADTERALRELNIADVTIVGGTAAVSEAVAGAVAAADVRVQRIAGSNRYDTSRRIADLAKSAGARPSRTAFATGRNFPDALAAGPVLARADGILLLLDGTDLSRSQATRSWVTQHAGSFEYIRVVGGTSVITEAVRWEIEDLAR
jgi:putative cell wall-binding protein